MKTKLFRLKKNDIFILNKKRYKFITSKYKRMPMIGKTLNAICLDILNNKPAYFITNFEVERMVE